MEVGLQKLVQVDQQKDSCDGNAVVVDRVEVVQSSGTAAAAAAFDTLMNDESPF